MEKICANYETIFVVDLSLGEDGVKQIVEKFTSMIAENGTIAETSEWGKRRLSYPVNDLNEGYWVCVKYSAPKDFPAELARVFNITEGVLRSITTRA